MENNKRKTNEYELKIKIQRVKNVNKKKILNFAERVQLKIVRSGCNSPILNASNNAKLVALILR